LSVCSRQARVENIFFDTQGRRKREEGVGAEMEEIIEHHTARR